MSRIDAIRRREQQATTGPWLEEPTPPGPDGWASCTAIAAVPGGSRIYAVPQGGSYPFNDKRFIAAAREDVPWLLDLITELAMVADVAEKIVEHEFMRPYVYELSQALDALAAFRAGQERGKG
jgi:hypothetical protein